MNGVTRRDLLTQASIASGAVAALAQAQSGINRRPNVVFILADDLGYGDLGCHGQTILRTPNIDRLASEGLRFRQAYSGSTVCAPSRCCLMTGKHTGHATVRGNVDPHMPLKADDLTVAELFQKAGYTTGAFGKWGLGTPPNYHALPTRKGFDRFYGYLHQVHAHTYFPDMLWDNEREAYFEPNFGGGKKVYSHDKIAERALAFIDENHAKPFFLYAPFTLPHGRFEVPSNHPFENENWPEPAKNFASMVTRLDASVGAIVERLRKYGIEENTLVIFTSDNGPVKVGVDHFKSAGPWRGMKRDMYEGGTRVPFLARWKDTITPGVTDQVFASWDFLPSVAELLGLACPSDIDGISIMPTLLGKPAAQKQHEYLYWEFFERGFQQAIRMGDWKGVRLKRGSPLELYNLAMDASEKNNIAAANPNVVQRLEDKLRTCRTKSEHWG